MQFVKLYNMVQQLRAGATNAEGASVTTFIDTSGTTRRFSTTSSNASQIQAENPFYCGGSGTVTSASTSVDYISFCASSETEIPFNTTSVPNQVGTTTSVYTRNSDGWNCLITVTANSEATINSFFALRKINGWSRQDDAVIWALKLDNPVELNADNNYTARFIFAVKFE